MWAKDLGNGRFVKLPSEKRFHDYIYIFEKNNFKVLHKLLKSICLCAHI